MGHALKITLLLWWFFPRGISLSEPIRSADLTESLFPASRLVPANCSQVIETGSEFQTYLSRLDNLRRSLVQDKFPLSGYRHVFYPAAAYDSGLVRLFENADVIAVDRHPTFPPEVIAQSSLPYSSGRGRSYLLVGDVDRDVYTGPRVLGGLRDGGYEIIDVRVFVLEGDVSRVNEIESPNVHMQVRFRENSTKPIRTYFQIQGEIPHSSEQARHVWWMRALAAEWLPDVVVAKGVTHTLTPQGNPFMHSTVLGWMNRTGGAVLEGVRSKSVNRVVGVSEFSGGASPLEIPESVSKHRTYPFAGRFGYGDSVRILQFEKIIN